MPRRNHTHRQCKDCVRRRTFKHRGTICTGCLNRRWLEKLEERKRAAQRSL